MRIYKSKLRVSGLVLASVSTLPAQARAGWGDENWGTMLWGLPASVPALEWFGLGVLALGLSATAAWTLRKRRPGLGLPVLLVLLAVPLVVVAGTVTLPNTFTNGTVADADQVNANFGAVKTAVDENDGRITINAGIASTALGTANGAVLDAAAAHGTADTAVTNAAAAQSTADAAAAGHTVNTNTQLTSAQVAAAATAQGFVTGAHTTDTQLTPAEVAAAAAAEGFIVGADHLFIDGAGRVGIGTAAPTTDLDIDRTAEAASVTARLFGGNGDTMSLELFEDFQTAGAIVQYDGAANTLEFMVGNPPVERMVLERTSGDVGIGVTNPANRLDIQDLFTPLRVFNTDGLTTDDGMLIRLGPTLNPGTGNDYIIFQDGDGTTVGSVDGSGSGGVRYNVTSDARLKQNVSHLTGALKVLASIRPREFEFKTRPGWRVDGFIAQELAESYPQAVSGEPDGDVETDPMMVDYSTLTTLLTGGVKELHELVRVQGGELKALKIENQT
ncbi:MAG TPA: tail fiber domain-containing protein, partial [Gemmatimonadetes bacterium]|nr:tail fiber domain-containing protein [Gemmatimonadota bacterium]